MEDNIWYLLLMGCSERKHAKEGLVPAIDLYDGVNYRVLHKAVNGNKEMVLPLRLVWRLCWQPQYFV